MILRLVIIILHIAFILSVIGIGLYIWDAPNEFDCYENYCERWNYDSFNECINLGVENCGLLCSNHYLLCDGIKIAPKCVSIKERLAKEQDISLRDILMFKCSRLEDREKNDALH